MEIDYLDEKTEPEFDAEVGIDETHGPTPIGENYSNIGLDGVPSHGMFKETTAWAVYNNEARKVDNELVKDWNASLNFLLVFVSGFHLAEDNLLTRIRLLYSPRF